MTNLTRFTERSPLVLAEARELATLPLQGVHRRNGSGSTLFYSLGSFNSATLGQTVYGGMKTRPEDKTKFGFATDPNMYFVSSLTQLIALDEFCPHLTELMPKFFGAVVENDTFKGILMEDYSKNGQSGVLDWRWPEKEDFPDGLLDKLDIDKNDESDLDDLAHVFGRTKEGIKIMDVNRIPWLEQYEKRRIEILGDLWTNRDMLERYVVRV